MTVKVAQLRAKLQALVAECAGPDARLSDHELEALPAFLEPAATTARRLSGQDEVTARGLQRAALGKLDRYIDRFTEPDGAVRRPQLLRSPDTPERAMSLTLLELAAKEVSYKTFKAPNVLRVYHVSDGPLGAIDPNYQSATGPAGLWTTTDPASAAGRTGTAHAFEVDLAGMFEGVDYIKPANLPWYLFCSPKALEALQRDAEADIHV